MLLGALGGVLGALGPTLGALGASWGAFGGPKCQKRQKPKVLLGFEGFQGLWAAPTANVPEQATTIFAPRGGGLVGGKWQLQLLRYGLQGQLQVT